MNTESVLFSGLIKPRIRKIKGKLYSAHEDFIVREIPLDNFFIGDISYESPNYPKGKEDKFVICTLVKRNISDFKVLEELSDFFRINYEDIGYNGLKDTFGITIQQISIPSKEYINNLERLKDKKFKKFFLKNAKFRSTPCRLREIWGNHFIIRIREFEGNSKDVQKILNEYFKGNRKFPNFYGYQRFGVRQNNHLIGKELIKRNFEKAIKIFCTDSNNENKDIILIRDKIKKSWKDWKKCYNLVKNNKNFDNESKIFKSLMENEKDYIESIKETNLATFFVNSYSGYLFNIVLKNLIGNGIELEYLPVLGYATNLNNDIVKKEYLDILNKEGINLEDFKNDTYKFLSCPGRIKEAFYRIENFNFRIGDSSIILEFSLPMGVYANLFLEHFFENKLSFKKLE